jgi:hypothetical protein
VSEEIQPSLQQTIEKAAWTFCLFIDYIGVNNPNGFFSSTGNVTRESRDSIPRKIVAAISSPQIRL